VSWAKFLDFMHLDAVTPQDCGSRLTGSLATVDEENFLARKTRAATKWRWAIHTAPETSAPFLGRVIPPKSAPRKGWRQQKYTDLASGLSFLRALGFPYDP
jgi:hypothetical protein